MVATHSSMQALGSAAPDFSLLDVCNYNALVGQSDFVGKPLMVVFICNHCPFVIHVIDRLAELANRFQTQGFGVLAISSNDALNYPQDGPELMREFAQQHGFEFAYCYDESQSVAKAFGAECTPDFYVYDKQHLLRYRGQMDDSRPGNGITVSGFDLDNAMRAVLEGREVSSEQQPSIGCSIKWKS